MHLIIGKNYLRAANLDSVLLSRVKHLVSETIQPLAEMKKQNIYTK